MFKVQLTEAMAQVAAVLANVADQSGSSGGGSGGGNTTCRPKLTAIQCQKWSGDDKASAKS